MGDSEVTNLPILYQNCLLQYSSEITKKAWLWFADRHDKTSMKYPSDRYAAEVDKLVRFLRPALHMAQDIHAAQGTPRLSGEGMDDLLRFILKRHANWRLGGNTTTWWE